MEERRIVSIKKIEKKDSKYLIYTSNNDEILVTEDAIVENRLIKGASFYEKDFKKIKKALDTNLLFDKVLKYIDYKPRTEKEIRDYLMEKNASNKEANDIVKKLIKNGFIDDKRFTRAYIEESVRKLKGPLYIKHTLQIKGINEGMINNELLKLDESIFLDNAIILANKYLLSLKGDPLQKQKQLLMDKLMREGYDYSLITIVLQNITFSEVDLDKLKNEYLKLSRKENDKSKIISKLITKGYDYSQIKQIIEMSEE